MGKVIGIDYGLKRVGIAISDETKTISFPRETVPTEKFPQYLSTMLEENKVDAIVFGYPLSLSGKGNEMTNRIDNQINKISQRNPELLIDTQDERFSSVEAYDAIKKSSLSKESRKDKSKVDQVSASIILDTYLKKLST